MRGSYTAANYKDNLKKKYSVTSTSTTQTKLVANQNQAITILPAGVGAEKMNGQLEAPKEIMSQKQQYPQQNKDEEEKNIQND